MLEELQAAGQAGGLGGRPCDVLVTRLVLRRQTTDEAMGMLVLRLPAVVSLEMKYVGYGESVLTTKGCEQRATCPRSPS